MKGTTLKVKSLLQGLALSIVSLLLFLGLLEGGLYLFGVEPISVSQDPFVGFAGNIPLFEEYRRAPNGNIILRTSKNKQSFFNEQVFVEQKASDTYRIFCLGGSTTYGRPYNDTTSFSGWLRELLPQAEQSRDWEVLNVGGISYASYRVARLMENLVQYQPDLFIVYTGQNEFLEERTYRGLLQVPEKIRNNIGLLAKTRTWAAMTSLLKRFALINNQQKPTQAQLAAEVDTILDHSVGPKDYQRDDQLRGDVLEHYRVSLQRMVSIAKKARAQIIFVTPASNLKDSSPFKSEHTAGLDGAKQRQVEGLLAVAELSLREDDPSQALALLNQAVELDPRFAKLHYFRGKALFALGRYDDAYGAFWRALDEDVCPLRALSPMPDIVREVAGEHDLPLVDFAAMVEKVMLKSYGHRIPGEELFLDHVHPTVDGHKILAASLLDKMTELGIVKPAPGWNKQQAIELATQSIESRIDVALQGWSLVNLAKVMHWAGKFEESERSARKALEMAEVTPVLVVPATEMLIKLAKLADDENKIDALIENALSIEPWSPAMHYQRGMRLLKEGATEKAAAHILMAAAYLDKNNTNSVLGLILYQRGYHQLALPLLERALLQKPSDSISREAIKALQKTLGTQSGTLPIPQIKIQHSPSGTPEQVFVLRRGPAGRATRDGYMTEWFPNGVPKRFVSYVRGNPVGIEVVWNEEGEEISRVSSRKSSAD